MPKGWDQSRFNATLKDYLKVTSRTVTESINAKSFFISRAAVLKTKKGRVNASAATQRIIGMVINKRRGKDGRPGLYGAKMDVAVQSVLQARRRSVAYIKSGWLPAIQALEQVVDAKYRRGAPRRDGSAKRYGKPKGFARPARVSFFPSATIANTIGSAGKRSKAQDAALERFGRPALEAAFDHETDSMIEYLEAHMNPDAKEFNRRQK